MNTPKRQGNRMNSITVKAACLFVLLASAIPAHAAEYLLFYLGGQSNMDGTGALDEFDNTPDERILRVTRSNTLEVATEPLNEAQWESIGWRHRQGISDMRVLFDYQRPTADGRIVIGGSDYPYYANDALSSGNNKPVIELLTGSLFTTFPQLEGLRIDHAWGGTMGFTLDFEPSVGVMGEHKNLFYGVAYNGEGVGLGQTAGRIISELIAGESSELTKLPVVNHKNPYLGPRSLRVVFARLYRWYLTRSPTRTVG